MTRQTLGDKTLAELIRQGWEFDHEASCRTYRAAGSVSPMKPRNGFEFCRVHHGRSVHARRFTYQITDVMRRAIK